MANCLIKIKVQRKNPEVGDVFVIQPIKDTYFFGKVFKDDAHYGLFEGNLGLLICIYDKCAISEDIPKNFDFDLGEPLIFPEIVSRRCWTTGYFYTIGNSPLTDKELNLDYGFKEPLTAEYILKYGLINGAAFYEDRFLDSYARKIDHKPKYLSVLALSNYGVIGQLLQDAIRTDPNLIRHGDRNLP